MRPVLFAALGLLFAASLAPYSSYAAGNVLLPADNSGGGADSLPNLGLSVQPKKTPDSAQPDMDSDSLPNLGLSVRPAKTPDSAKKSGSPESKPADVSDPKKKTKSIKDTPVNEGPSHSLIISLSENSSFGPKDIEKIKNKLGLDDDEISSSCTIALRGVLISDKSTYSIGDGSTQETTVHYDGNIKNFSIMAQSLCRVDGDLPSGNERIGKVNDRYALALKQVKCAPPTEPPARLTITYDGIGAPKCEYE